MKGIDIGIIASVVGLIITVIKIGMEIGKLKAKVDNNAKVNEEQETKLQNSAAKKDIASLEGKIDEERRSNLEAHKEIFASVNNHKAQIAELKVLIQGIKESIESNFKEIKEELKEMRRRT